MAEPITAARPYARAAFETARERNEVAQWSQALAALAALVSAPEAGRLINDPHCSKAQTGERIVEILGDVLNPHGRNFVRLLAVNQRLNLANEVAALFEQYRADAECISVVEIVSAQDLGETQRDALCRAVERRTGRKAEAAFRTDETLLGGAVVRIGDLVVDGSLKTKLEKLSQTLIH